VASSEVQVVMPRHSAAAIAPTDPDVRLTVRGPRQR
jgi:hypothetical protein